MTDAVTSDEVLAALERVLNSDAFLSAPQSRNFLAFVVTETLAGRGDRLSERTVGRGAMDRPDDFDGRFDASVRVRATRVRKALEAYNATSHDPVRIHLPAGTYIPVFSTVHSPRRPELETAVVVTAATGDSEGFSEALSQEMTRQLEAFPGLRVIGPIATDHPTSVADGLDVRFVLHIAMVEDAPAVEITVLDMTSDATVWAARENPAADAAAFDVGYWAQSIAGRIGDYNGVILSRFAQSGASEEPDWRAMQAYYTMFTSGDRTAVIPAADGLTRLVNGGHRSPTILAALAHALSLRAAYELSEDVEADKATAVSLADEALAGDATSATAHLALATVALFSDQPGSTQEHAQQAASLAGFHPSILGTAGTLMAHAGDWRGGIDALREALRLNPDLPGYSRVLLVMDNLFSGDDALALAEAARIETPTEAWGSYFRALALMGLGYRDQALDEMKTAMAIDPTVLDDPESVVKSYVQLTTAQRHVLADRLRMFTADV